MSSSKEERESMYRETMSCPQNADILVGGLGLGVVLPHLCLEHPKSITVYEINPSIVQIIWPKVDTWCRKQYGVKMNLIVDDIRKATGLYDFIFVDIWKTNGREERNVVLGIKELSKRLLKPTGRTVC